MWTLHLGPPPRCELKRALPAPVALHAADAPALSGPRDCDVRWAPFPELGGGGGGEDADEEEAGDALTGLPRCAGNVGARARMLLML